VDLSEMIQVAQLIEMVLNSHQGSTFQSSQSHHPNEFQVSMKWLELLHERDMVLQNEIPEIDLSR
jgi:hypothetical protein